MNFKMCGDGFILEDFEALQVKSGVGERVAVIIRIEATEYKQRHRKPTYSCPSSSAAPSPSVPRARPKSTVGSWGGCCPAVGSSVTSCRVGSRSDKPALRRNFSLYISVVVDCGVDVNLVRKTKTAIKRKYFTRI